MKKIVTIIGARPQFIKAAAVSRVIQKSGELREVIVHTGQHFDENMSSVFFREMEIPEPDYNLQINSLSHGAMTGRMLEKIEEVLLKEKPDFLMVYGDTNSTIAGALAAKKLDIRVIHIEAGLRSFNLKMPEEINRILTDRISNLLFCPTENAVQNLLNEGFSNFKCQIHEVGDVMYDTALYYGSKSSKFSDIIARKNLRKNGFILCTIHRQENTDNLFHLKSIIQALNNIHREIPVILPLHPRTRKIMKQQGVMPEFEPIDPVGYFDILELLKNCNLVMTDSGGMQKEAYFFKKYCITLRKETEWVELVNNHYNILAGPDEEAIRTSFNAFKDKEIPQTKSLYGDGDASMKIINSIIHYQL